MSVRINLEKDGKKESGFMGFGIFILKRINIIPNNVAIIKGFLNTCFTSFNLLISLPE